MLKAVSIRDLRCSCPNALCYFEKNREPILAFLLFSTCLFLQACAVTDSLLHFCFSDVHREAAHAQMTRRRGMTCKSLDCVRFVFFWPTSLSCNFCMGGLPRTLPKARIHKRFGRRTRVQKEKLWKRQGSNNFYTKINKISFGFVTRVSHVTDPTPLCESLMFFCPFIFATRSEAKNVSFGTP